MNAGAARQPAAFLIGVLAGVGGGLVSLGGGTLVIPLLMGWLGMNPLNARGTAMAVSLFSAGTGALIYARHGMLDLPVAIWVAVPAFILAPLLAKWSENWPAQRLKRGFGLVVAIGGVLVIFREQLTGGVSVPEAWQHAYLLSVGIVEGAVSGIIGISGGPVLAPLFVLGLGMPQQLAQGCSLAARLPAVVSGTWENGRLGNIRWRLVPALAAGGVVGAWGGSRLALALPEHQLRSGFGLLLIALGWHYLRGPQRASGDKQ
ncbi:MAG TPA: sulfite exporter TauE/SafE family protein [Chromatiaceae bacterium]|nr:sulfite exporter TauE/SafE family protein [Chromatiaceae bacterium]